VKNNDLAKRIAKSKDIARLAQRASWQDVKLSSGDIVPAEAIRAIFDDAAAGLKRKRKRSRVHATAP